MELREATAADLDALVDRWYSLASSMEPLDDLNELVFTDSDAVSTEGFRDRLDDDAITDYLVVHQSETIGFVTLREGHHPSRQYSHYLRIVDLLIDEAWRDQGLGTEVVRRVEEMAKARGCDHLKVSCEWRNEDARRFYRSADFRPKQVEHARPLE